MAIIRDRRNPFWRTLEKTIQSRAKKKDRSFRLSGTWKKFLRMENGYNIFAVNGTWIRNNLSAYFGHGGHGFVHEFIPLDEIWVSTHHYDEGDEDVSKCNCTVKKKGQKVSKKYFESTLLHEMTECIEMKIGKPYWEAHNIALDAEREAGFLVDPFEDL